MKWPGPVFDNNGTEWICSICGAVANNRSSCLRQAVRYFHTVGRCAEVVRGYSLLAREEAIKKARAQGGDCFREFVSLVFDGASGSNAREAETRSRSRSPPRRGDKQPIVEIDTDEFIGRRIAKLFDKALHFGTVVERIRGAVLASQPNVSQKVLQVVWKIVYDDKDDEMMTRQEIAVAMRTHMLHQHHDVVEARGVQRNLPLLANVSDEEPDEHRDHGVFGTGTDFLDERYCLLDKLTPTANQNRLSYLVELLLDKYNKGISNEALKLRLRKDAIAFGADNMPTDIHSIAKFLGSRTCDEVTRHRCVNNDCSYAWLGVVPPRDYDSNDRCPDCDSPRYIRKGGKLLPQRVLFYFGAARAIEALHRHPVF